jgi:hypothetical protein
MHKHWGWTILLLLAVLAFILAGCAPAAAPATQQHTIVPAAIPTQPPAAPAQVTAQPAPVQTQAPQTSPESPLATAFPELPEARQVELEFPATMQLGDSDVIRLSLVPSQAGYTVQAEFPDHQTASEEVVLQRPAGYTLFAVARLDGVAFDLTPEGEQVRSLPSGEPVSWSWSLTARRPGRQRLALTLLLRLQPAAVQETALLSVRESTVFSRGLEVQVTSILGMAPAQAQIFGLVLLIGIGLVTGGFFLVRRVPRATRVADPNPALSIEPAPGLSISGEPQALFKTLFAAYARLIVSSEFLSGYSGARTFLAQPIRADGRADAYTIVKIGAQASIEREYGNYETFVKDTLPPVTARIQHAPVRLKRGSLAALRYTFIGEAGRAPVSLRQALLASPDPDLLRQLFTTFGPYWWQQRRPYTFCLGSEYDALLPAHAVLIPERGAGRLLDGISAPGEVSLAVGDLVTLRHFPTAELRADGQSLSLTGTARPGQPPLRLRWMSLERPEGATGRITATRQTLLAERVAGMERCGLPDPLPRLPELLGASIHGTRSIVHGDLNLENILIGPGRLVWLIDFAATREGHTLLDFAHLEAEIVGRVLPAYFPDPRAYLDQLSTGQVALLNEVEAIAHQCLFDPADPREYRLALTVACLGALKHANLDEKGRHFLYLTAAFLASSFM